MLQWTLKCMCLFELQFSQGICPVEGFLDHMVLFLVFLSNLYTVLHSGYNRSHPHHSTRRSLFLHMLSSIYSLQIFLMMVILTSVWWYLIVVLICVSLIMSDVEHLFMCLLATCMSSLEKCLFRDFSHFLIGLFFWHWVVWTACIFWKLILCQSSHLLLFLPIPRVVFSLLL